MPIVFNPFTGFPDFVSDTTAGPATQLDANGTVLDVDAISDGQFLKRSGTSIVGAASAGGPIETATHDFTAAELASLDVTPIELIAAPGSGFAILPLLVVTRTIGGTVSYDEGVVRYFWGNSGGREVTGGQNYPAVGEDLITTTSGGFMNGVDVAEVEDLAVIAVNDATDPSTGDGTANTTIYYITVAV